jgi:polyisoprenyl-phosphate glycosyltransferase
MIDPDTHPQKPRISAIIPTYNEELNLGDVLEVLKNCEILDEIILVDDGSTDKTPAAMEKASGMDGRIRIVRHEKNLGKGQAIFSGWAATSAPILLLLDADLKSLSPTHIEQLIEPVLHHKADMTLGLFHGGRFSTDLSHWLTPFLTGQRGIRSKVLNFISPEAASGYGFEVALTIAAKRHGFRTKIVPLKGVWHPSSEFRTERGGYWKAKVWRFRMYGEIVRALFLATRKKYTSVRAYFSNLEKP